MIDCGICRLRPWRPGDADSLRALADDESVARWLADSFPHPYTQADARLWVATCGVEPFVRSHFAIEVAGALAGGAGVTPYAGERRFTAHIGYWLGRRFWGRGIATAACRELTAYAFAELGVARLETTVYAPNAASARVLEKCGFVREGVMRDAIAKGDGVYDAWLYAKLKT